MAKPSVESDLKINGNRFLLKLQGDIAEDMDFVMKCMELQAEFKKKIKEE